MKSLVAIHWKTPHLHDLQAWNYQLLVCPSDVNCQTRLVDNKYVINQSSRFLQRYCWMDSGKGPCRYTCMPLCTSAPWSGNCIWTFHSFYTRSSLLLNIDWARGRRQQGSVQHDWWHYTWSTHSRLVIKWMAVMSYMNTKPSFDDELAWCAVVTMIGLVATFLVPWSLLEEIVSDIIYLWIWCYWQIQTTNEHLYDVSCCTGQSSNPKSIQKACMLISIHHKWSMHVSLEIFSAC